MLVLKHITLIDTKTSGISVHAAMPLLSKKTSSNFSLRNTRRLPMVLDWAVGNEGVKLLRTKRITCVEQIAYVLISILTAGQGIVAIARTVTKGTHTS